MKPIYTIIATLGLISTTYGGNMDVYIKDLIASGQIQSAAIIDGDGGIRTASAGFKLIGKEGQTIVGLFKNLVDAFDNGIVVGGVKYVALKADSASIYGKKGTGGVILVKTAQNILIGIYDDPTQTGSSSQTAETIGKRLRDNGY